MSSSTDAARPAVAFSDIDALMEAAEKHQAVALSTPVRTGLVEVDEGGSPVAFHTPTNYRHILTPQAFSRETFLELASKKAEIHPSRMTLLERLAPERASRQRRRCGIGQSHDQHAAQTEDQIGHEPVR